MKKLLAIVFVALMLLLNISPGVLLAAEEKTPPPASPYEKVVAKSGNWYVEQLSYDGLDQLVVGYLGAYKADGARQSMEFEIGEKIVVSGIYLPFVGVPSEPVSLRLIDRKGNVYPGFTSQMTAGGKLEQVSSAAGDNREKIDYLFTPENELVLPKGQYTITLSNPELAAGPFLIKGINFKAYERYREELQKWNLETSGQATPVGDIYAAFGDKALSGDNDKKYEYDAGKASVVKRPPAFALDGDYLIDEVILNTYNGGKGAPPGTISIRNTRGDILVSQAAYGGSLGEVANGIWKIAPNIVLPAGNYVISLSDPGVLTYDQTGEALFYVKASLPVTTRIDFTGTYKLSLDAYKASTLAGKVSENNSSFSLKDFELTVLDKDGTIELIGQYEGMPFSQDCKIVEETENSITAEFDFKADLSKLPYKAKIAAIATVILTKPMNGIPVIDVKGEGVYDRAASAEKGADHNTYALVANGAMAQRELPPFVMTALGKSSGAGNVPGPENPVQAATGMLFPPLVGLVTGVLQELLKPKPKATPTVRDRSWYKKKYPHLNDEQLAMVMLGDAMGNTDNPDEGDAVSLGDNESANDYSPSLPEEDESEASFEEPQPEDEPIPEDELMPELEKNTLPAAAEDTIPTVADEPEEIVLQTSAGGAQSRYVRDPATGEWINPETGGVLDYEGYTDAVEKQFADDQKFNDEQFDTISRGKSEHDRSLREAMQKISDQEEQEAYKDMMRSKYGLDNTGDIEGILRERAEKDRASFEKWQMIGDINAAGEVGATVVGAVADTSIDGLANVVPGGKGIRAIYKVAKGVAGTSAEKGINAGSVLEGAIKGGADAGLDYINLNNPYANAGVKAVTTVVGETVGSAAGAALRGGKEDWLKAGTEGMVDGIFKAGVNTAMDNMVGDLPDLKISGGSVEIIPTMKNVLVNKTAGQKIGGSLIDEFAVKPIVVDTVKAHLPQKSK